MSANVKKLMDDVIIANKFRKSIESVRKTFFFGGKKKLW